MDQDTKWIKTPNGSRHQMVPRCHIYILPVYVTRFSSSNTPPTLTRRQVRASDSGKTQNLDGSLDGKWIKRPNLHTACLCNTVFLLKYSTNLDKKTSESQWLREDSDYISMQEKLLTFPLHMKKLIKQIVGNHLVAMVHFKYIITTQYIIW